MAQNTAGRAILEKHLPPASSFKSLDDGVSRVLPPGTSITDIEELQGLSSWARTAKVSGYDAEGRPVSFFLKVLKGELGRLAVESESYSMNLLYTAIPDNVPKPVGHGACLGISDSHFYICKYHEMQQDSRGGNLLPNKESLAAVTAELHYRTLSRGGNFGCKAGKETLVGSVTQHFPEVQNWADCFAEGLQTIFEAESKAHEVDLWDDELDDMEKDVINKVIPNLLGALQDEDRDICPCLVHGDLWTQNMAVDSETNETLIYDAGVLYAHNEYELGLWYSCALSCPMLGDCVQEYTKYFKPSEPMEQFSDRVKLYALRPVMHASSTYPGEAGMRDYCRTMAKDVMRELISTYGQSPRQVDS